MDIKVLTLWVHIKVKYGQGVLTLFYLGGI